MRDLIVQYEHGLQLLRQQAKELKHKEEIAKENKDIEGLAIIKSDRTLVNGMISDMEYEIQWMKTGKRPDAKRGAENLAAYQREVSVDPNRFLHRASNEPEVRSEKELNMLEYKAEEMLYFLSKSERDVYMLHYGYGFSEEYIAKLNGKSKGTITKLLSRARKKIDKKIENSS